MSGSIPLAWAPGLYPSGESELSPGIHSLIHFSLLLFMVLFCFILLCFGGVAF